MADISKRVEKAEKLIQKGRLDDALTEYLYAFKEDPANDGLVEIIAELYLKQNQAQKAVECYAYLFDKRTEQKDGPSAVLMYRKMARLGLQEPARMLACAGFLVKTKPAEARDYFRQCVQLFTTAGNREQALEALRGLAQVEQKNAEVHSSLAEMAEGLGQTQLAAQSYGRAGELLAASANGAQAEQAIALFERAYSLTPSDAALATSLASTLYAAGKAARAAEVLEPFAAENVPERNRLLADAYLAAGNAVAAEEVLWKMPPTVPDVHAQLWPVLDRHLGSDGAGRDAKAALAFLYRMKQTLFASRKEDEFIARVKGLHERGLAGVEVLGFLAETFAEMNRPSDLAGVLALLFDVQIDSADHASAAGSLERLMAANPSDLQIAEQNKQRLERLRGKLDGGAFQSLEARIAQSAVPASSAMPGVPAGGSIEEMVLQAEMLVQFSSRESAIEYIQGLLRAFPGAETQDEHLRELMVEMGMISRAAPRPASGPQPVAQNAPQAVRLSGGIALAAGGDVAANLGAAQEVTRAISRQGSVKGALSACVNGIGKAWEVSRCVAGLCVPGKPPTAALEYCAPGTPPSDVASIVKLVTTLVQLTSNGDMLAVENAEGEPTLAGIAPIVQALGIRSLLVLPVMDNDQPAGVVLLEQCDRPRAWHPNEIFVAKTIVDQLGIAMANVKLRSLVKAVADERSGLISRGAYLDCLVTECGRAHKQHTPFSAALLRFSAAADLGEKTLQRFMQEAGEALTSQLRENDVGVRYDSTTLAVVLPDTRGKDLPPMVERIRKAMATVRAGGRETLPMTASMGEAFVSADIESADMVTDLINRLDETLDAAIAESVPAKLAAMPQASG